MIIVLSVMIVTTIVGNILVCLSVVLVKKLRHPSNYLLVSLAISGESPPVFPFAALHSLQSLSRKELLLLMLNSTRRGLVMRVLTS